MQQTSLWLERVRYAYNRMLSSGDPRVTDWAMMASPMPTLSIIGAYLFVVWYGQKVMVQRKSGFEIRNIMVFYNVCMVALSLWMVCEFCAAGWIFGGYSLGCQPVDRSMHPQALRMARVCWVYYISKLIELSDTIFFILRRKFQLITFLHVYHHVVTALTSWFYLKFIPGGMCTLQGLINSFIHVWMYTYYALAAAGPRFHRYLWWKNSDMREAGSLFERVKSAYSRMLSSGDPRVSNWMMMASPMPTFGIVGAYLFIVWYGQKVMAQRKSGFEIRNIMVFYNVCLVALSIWMVHEFSVAGWIFGGYSLGCQPVDRSMHPQALRMARVCWVYYISKLIELADTVFFILRRKFQLITFLHVYHHVVMALSWWFFVKYVPGGISTFHALINSFIHFWMYSYYALAAAGPQFYPYLWWKQHLTTAQIVQFFAVIAHTTQLFFFKDCDYPMPFGLWILFCAFSLLFLFLHFYYQSYIKPRKMVIVKKFAEMRNEVEDESKVNRKDQEAKNLRKEDGYEIKKTQ
ncbi:hypothetical protein Aperf_G00000108681 [Anoplocephala perfoliata]